MFRRSFIKKYVGYIGLLFILPSCGGSDSSSKEDGSDEEIELCSANNPDLIIGANHDHTLTIPIADIIDEIPNTYNLTTGAGHVHTVTLTLSEIISLKDSGSITKNSSFDAGHDHPITVNCVG